MANPFLRMTGVLVTAGLAGATLAPFSMASAAQFTPAPSFKIAYTYSSQLVSRYTAGCSDKLRSKGKSAAQAQQLCQCSLKNMQAQHSQGEAISILMRAQFSGSKDPRTGLPSALSKYFASCSA
jgi:hypothetical protein